MNFRRVLNGPLAPLNGIAERTIQFCDSLKLMNYICTVPSPSSVVVPASCCIRVYVTTSYEIAFRHKKERRLQNIEVGQG